MVLDLIYLAGAIGFVAFALGAIVGCDWLKHR